MSIGLQLVTGPTAEPLPLAKAKRRLRVTTDAEDSDIEDLIAECREQAEDECGRAFLPQTLRLALDRFPRHGRPIAVPRPPLRSVTSVTYYDVAGELQTMAAEDYGVELVGEPGRIYPAATWWPETASRPGAVQVVYVAGYASATAVPRQAVAAVLALVCDRHVNPDGGDRPVPPAARRMLDALDVRGFGYDVTPLRESGRGDR